MLEPMIFKIIVIGDPQVGKTSISVKYTSQKFQKECIRTIGLNTFFKNILVQVNEIRLMIYDLPRGEFFRELQPLHYNDSFGCLLLFDVTRFATFENLSGWIDNIQANIGWKIPILIVGNKIDVVEENWEIEKSEIRGFAENCDLSYILTSAKTGQNVKRSFEMLTTEIISVIMS